MGLIGILLGLGLLILLAYRHCVVRYRGGNSVPVHCVVRLLVHVVVHDRLDRRSSSVG